ncbi:MAG: diaminopimelate epimerase [Saprospiraceae bacterium]
MNIPFEKYQGTGNDFILLDQREKKYIGHHDHDVIRRWCDRRFGIGADGLILLEKSADYDFRMVYFNADGHEGSMCGNGGRCIVQYAHSLGIFTHDTLFDAVDGTHKGKVAADGLVSIEMIDVSSVNELGSDTYVLNTGSPHYVTFVHEFPADIKKAGQDIRYSPAFAATGINVNFVKKTALGLEIATYERGVEDETYSCGTGVTATAICEAYRERSEGMNDIKIVTKGGMLHISLRQIKKGYFEHIWLTGPAEKVYDGMIQR